MFTFTSKAALATVALASALALFTRASHLHPKHESHAFIPAGPDDSRSPCPALNALANHGYIARNGKNISPFDLIPALRDVYNLDGPLSHFLSLGGFWLLNHPPLHAAPLEPDFKHPLKVMTETTTAIREAMEPRSLLHSLSNLYQYIETQRKYPTMDLSRIGLHDHVEHHASVTHDDILDDSPIAPWASNTSLFDAFLADSHSKTHIDLVDLATARVRREKESELWYGHVIDPMHALIARGEAALVIGIFGEPMPGAPSNVSHYGDEWSWEGIGVSFETMRTFWLEERIPDGWKPTRVTSIHSTDHGNKIVGKAMATIRARQDGDAHVTHTAENATDTTWVNMPQQVMAIPETKA